MTAVYNKFSSIQENLETSEESIVEKLNTEWSLYYRDQTTKSTSSENFSNDMVNIISCNTIMSFWQILNVVPFPTQLNRRNNSSYMFFRANVKPTWEDKANQNGGMWRIVIKKHEDRGKYLDTFWLELLMAMVGEQFRNSMEITGCVVKRRQKEDRIELWTKGHDDVEMDQVIQMSIGEDLKGILGIKDELEYTKHESVKNMDVLRRAGNKNRSFERKCNIVRNISSNDVFSQEFKNKSFEYKFGDTGKYRV